MEIKKELDNLLAGAIVDSALLHGVDMVVGDAGFPVRGIDPAGNRYFLLTSKEDERVMNEALCSKIANSKYTTVALTSSSLVDDAFWRKRLFYVRKEYFMKAAARTHKDDHIAFEGIWVRHLEMNEALAIAANLSSGEPNLAYLHDYLSRKYALSNGRIGVNAAMVNGQPCGMIVQTLHGKYMRIDWIGTFSGFKGKGIARRLIGHALEEANSTGREVFIKIQSPYKLHFDHLGFETFEEIEYFTFRFIYPTSIEGLPEHVPYNGVLRSKRDFQERIAQLAMLDLPMHGDLPKNWDSYAALDIILRHSGGDRKDANILDAGGESYSPILYQLEACGFRNLKCINLCLEGIEGVKNITYEYGDITATRFEDDEFDFVVCLSVIEHGVDAERYLREMHRILRKGGLLITSTDYWATPVDTSGRVAYNASMKIFDAAEIIRVADLAKETGFRLKAELELDCSEKTVNWLGMDYTFLYFTLEKI